MSTNTNRTARKKVTRKVNAAKNANRVTMTAVQARRIQTALAKAGVNYKFLDTKLANL